ncbi:MAG: hypothetical protein KKG01_03510, partial [Candidatus Omnitrophica bacterium]|nr:hypothetical protein [Candidatus Omnitrophota bacterium]
MWSEDGGFDLWRHLTNTDVSNKHIEYKTWGEGNPPKTKGLIIIRGGANTRGNVSYFSADKVDFPSDDMSVSIGTQWIYIYNKSKDGESIIEADNYYNSPEDQTGINEAIYYAKNTKDDIKQTLARIERPAGTTTYNIDGMCWEYGGAVTTGITLDREIGGDVGERKMHIMRNDFEYDFTGGTNPISDPWGGCYSWDTVGEESTESLTLDEDEADYLNGIKAEWYYDKYFGFWRGLRFVIDEKSEGEGGLRGASDVPYIIELDLDGILENNSNEGFLIKSDTQWIYSENQVGDIEINLFPEKTYRRTNSETGVHVKVKVEGESGDQIVKVTLTRDTDIEGVTQQIADFEFIIDNTPATQTLRQDTWPVKQAKMAEATDNTSKTLIILASGSKFEQTVGLVGNKIHVYRKYKGESPFINVPDSGGPEIILDNIKNEQITPAFSEELTWLTSTDRYNPYPGTVHGKIDKTLGGKTDMGAIGGFETSFLIVKASAAGLGPGSSASSYPVAPGGSWTQPEFQGSHFSNFIPIGAMESRFTEEADDADVYGEINLKWDYYGDPNDTLIIERSTSLSFTNVTTFTLLGTKSCHKTHKDTSVEKGVTYYYRIKAIKPDHLLVKESKFTDPMSAHSYWEPPKEIEDPNIITEKLVKEIKLQWSYDGNPEDSFEIWRSIDGKNYTRIQRNYKSKSFIDTNVEPGKLYYYKVYAVNPDPGKYQKKSAASEKSGTPRYPGAGNPGGGGSDVGIGEINLSWNAAPDAFSYNIYYRTDPSANWVLLKGKHEDTTYKHTNLTAGQIYYYKIVSVNGDNNEGGEILLEDVPKFPNAGGPGGGSSGAGIGELDLQWNEAPEAFSYNIYYRTSPSGRWILLKEKNEDTSYRHTNLTPGQTYYYKIVSVNGDGVEGGGIFLEGIPKFPDAQAPRNLLADATIDTVTLNWSQGQDAVSYNVYLDGRLVATVSDTTYTHTGLNPDTTYSFKVVSINGGSFEGANAVTDVTTGQEEKPAPPKPKIPVDIMAAGSEGVDESLYETLAPSVIEGVRRGLLANITTLAQNLGLTLEAAREKIAQMVEWLKGMGSLVINCASRAL